MYNLIPDEAMKFEFEEFQTVEDVLVHLVVVAPPMKQIQTLNSYRGYTFAMVPLSPLSGDNVFVVYTKAQIEPGLIEFDISTQNYRKVTAVERPDRNYFIVTNPKSNTLADQAIDILEGGRSQYEQK